MKWADIKTDEDFLQCAREYYEKERIDGFKNLRYLFVKKQRETYKRYLYEMRLLMQNLEDGTFAIERFLDIPIRVESDWYRIDERSLGGAEEIMGHIMDAFYRNDYRLVQSNVGLIYSLYLKNEGYDKEALDYVEGLLNAENY